MLARTILATGAEANCIRLTLHKAQLANAIFNLNLREIVGAGRTEISAFAHFTLKIEGLATRYLAYVLNHINHFRYDLLLGWGWLRNLKPIRIGKTTPTSSFGDSGQNTQNPDYFTPLHCVQTDEGNDLESTNAPQGSSATLSILESKKDTEHQLKKQYSQKVRKKS
ncbi:hypothetical protein EDB87DRAFT_343064 [Lactarius vividus]|nr:hypothetical protein EDB87DRAFT_343064 [Lactarius vividus]